MSKIDLANVVIIGGGCNGLSAAYYLASAGVKDIVVLERSYLGAGSTGRCGGGMRQQWSTKGNIDLSKYSIDRFKNFANEIGQDIEFEEGGYILPAYTDDEKVALEKNIVLQNSCGVDSRWVKAEEVFKIAPLLNVDGMLGAAYCATDGKSNPFLVVKGYSERCLELGVKICTNTAVTALECADNKVTGVITNKGKIATQWVINVAGAYVAHIAMMVGVDVPITPYRHQGLVTEPVEHCFDPMFINLHESLYFSQAKNGGFVIGQTDKNCPSGINLSENWLFEVEIAKKIMKYAPKLRDIKVVRHWAGHYAVTPDRQPIIGLFSQYDNFLMAGGYSGHGFMHAPATGHILADLVVSGKTEVADLTEYSIERFNNGNLVVEANVV